MLTRGLDARVHFDGQLHCDLMEMDRVLIRRYRNPLRILHPRATTTTTCCATSCTGASA
ncbi:inorganic polyphosphate/ATP-NAD kinase [Chromobacterium violaceum]|uniref:Inorganic polyphosphate/ATP-NAD kinase n=1 Tax=Chromobacterium violaceum TaxID=536 RepID=A0A3S4LKE9_CHRVL|nr:inorganic polyphosphate/ATP-NAD kinase [Chromobacterium violaceum]